MADDRSDGGTALPDPAGDTIDHAIFSQILEMDDDEDEREFSKSIVYDFFDQARNTFETMDAAFEESDLPKLSQLGHFLKGSSATLGMTKVKDSCEKIQHFGARKDETGTEDQPDDEQSLRDIRRMIDHAKVEFARAEQLLKHFYHDDTE